MSFVSDLYEQFNALMHRLGATYDSVSFAYDTNSGRQGQNPMFYFGSGVNDVSAFSTGGEVHLSQDEVELAASRGILGALKGTTLPK